MLHIFAFFTLRRCHAAYADAFRQLCRRFSMLSAFFFDTIWLRRRQDADAVAPRHDADITLLIRWLCHTP